jgi:collagenase-like PrtC family protease
MAEPDDYQIAVQAAMQMAERFGEDVAIMADLSVMLLKEADSPSIEIIRCPARS